jgi:histidinol-phosphate aminotransferase
LPISPKAWVQAVSPIVHGSPDYAELRELGIAPQSLIDFSVGFNPLGAPPGLWEKLASQPVDRYPDSQAAEFREALARKLKLKPENVIAGNGSSELMWLCCMAYFGPGDRVLIIEPTFGEYERACLIAGSQPVKIKATPPDFQIQIETIIHRAKDCQAKGIFLCNPNNPTGTYLEKSAIERLLDSLPDCLLILDEAYAAFTDSLWRSEGLIHKGNVIILRSMTKDYALAGLRLGYALAEASIISNLWRVCPPWNVNALAQKAGILALREKEHLRRGQQIIKESKDFLYKELVKLGVSPLLSRTNFFLVKVGQAAAVRKALLQKGILVRDCTSFGLPEYIRLAALSLTDCEKLIKALTEILKSES